jgi:hypothetical protein
MKFLYYIIVISLLKSIPSIDSEILHMYHTHTHTHTQTQTYTEWKTESAEMQNIFWK